MIFFNEYFVLALLVSTLFFWTVVPEQFRTKFLIGLGCVLLGILQLKFTIFLVAMVIAVFYGTKVMVEKPRLKVLAFWLIALVIVLVGFKYFHIIFDTIAAPEHAFSKTYLVPLGVSYLIFKLIAFVLDVFRGEIKDPRLEELLAFILFIPSFPAGPIERYQNFASSRKPEFETSFYISGLQRIALGYFKKVVLVNFIMHEIVQIKLYPVIMNNGVELGLGSAEVLCFLVGSLIYAYLDLSAYADLAIGMGQLFGYKLCENMNYPIFRKNLSDYWNCWHISLSHWCRNNVYFPVLGHSRNNVLALYSSFTVMGLWHYLSLNWLLWGMWHATGITVFSKWNRFKKRKKLRGKVPKSVGYAMGMILTVLYSSLGFAFISMKSTEEAVRLLLAIFL